MWHLSLSVTLKNKLKVKYLLCVLGLSDSVSVGTRMVQREKKGTCLSNPGLFIALSKGLGCINSCCDTVLAKGCLGQ